MKFVNRGYLLVTATKEFIRWANSVESAEEMNEEFIEGTVYLIEEDFFEIEPIISSNFKKILKNELSMVTENEGEWPEKLNLETFEKFFNTELGNTVFDLQKTDLVRD